MRSSARAEAPAKIVSTSSAAQPAREEPGSAGNQNVAAPAGDARDAAALQSLLDRHFRESEEQVAPVTPPVAAPAPPSRWRSRVVKSLLGLALAVIAGWMPIQRLFQVSSVEAVVNARLVTVRAPIAGTVSVDAPAGGVGEAIAAGAPLLTVSDARVDRSRLEAALEQRAAAREERQAFAARLQNLEQVRAGLRNQLEAFRTNRLRQIDAEMTQAEARIEAARAEQTRAAAVRQRQSALVQSGSAAQAVMDDATRDMAVATATIKEAEGRRAALGVERDALSSGTWLGDDYNDQPRSAQQLEEIAQQIASIEAETARLDARIERAAEDIAEQQRALTLVSEARVTAPVEGRVWEVLTAPGEQVAAGQPLFSLLDCAHAMVTANVSEAVYNSLSVGMPASFTFREGAGALQGKVVQLSGIAAASSNFAILPSALTKEPYHATIAVTGLDRDGSCPVGRTGRVVFGGAS